MRPFVRPVALAALSLLVPVLASAQDSAIPLAAPCREYTCRIVWDWGGTSPASFGSDRRYGPATDLEVLVPQFLIDKGFKVSGSAGDQFVITILPRMRTAMCDQMAGTDTDMSCHTASDVNIRFSSGNGVKAANPIRVINRCGAGNTFLTIKDFSIYTADMIIYSLDNEKTRGKRPSTKC
jgi:hypothetical protein